MGLTLVNADANNLVSTTYDGVTREKYVSYLYVNGSSGA
jgi:hypothetical protein